MTVMHDNRVKFIILYVRLGLYLPNVKQKMDNGIKKPADDGGEKMRPGGGLLR